MNNYREKKIVLLVKECVFVTKHKSLATGHYTNGHKRWPPYDIWSDDQV